MIQRVDQNLTSSQTAFYGETKEKKSSKTSTGAVLGAIAGGSFAAIVGKKETINVDKLIEMDKDKFTQATSSVPEHQKGLVAEISKKISERDARVKEKLEKIENVFAHEKSDVVSVDKYIDSLDITNKKYQTELDTLGIKKPRNKKDLENLLNLLEEKTKTLQKQTDEALIAFKKAQSKDAKVKYETALEASEKSILIASSKRKLLEFINEQPDGKITKDAATKAIKKYTETDIIGKIKSRISLINEYLPKVKVRSTMTIVLSALAGLVLGAGIGSLASRNNKAEARIPEQPPVLS